MIFLLLDVFAYFSTAPRPRMRVSSLERAFTGWLMKLTTIFVSREGALELLGTARKKARDLRAVDCGVLYTLGPECDGEGGLIVEELCQRCRVLCTVLLSRL